MKKLILFSAILSINLVNAADEQAVELMSKVPEMKETSEKIFKDLSKGFKANGLSSSPGHKAILTEMKNYYQLIKKFNWEADTTEVFPKIEWERLEASRLRVAELQGFVIIDEDLEGILEKWTTKASEFSSFKKEEPEDLEYETMASILLSSQGVLTDGVIVTDSATIDPGPEGKEQRLKFLEERFQFLREQQEALSSAGLFTTDNTLSNFTGGYYYNNGVFYPVNRNTGTRSGTCTTGRSRFNIIIR